MDNLQTLCEPCNLGKHSRVDIVGLPGFDTEDDGVAFSVPAKAGRR